MNCTHSPWCETDQRCRCEKYQLEVEKEELIEENFDTITEYGISNSPEDFRSKDTFESDAEHYIESLTLSEIKKIINHDK